MASCILEMHLGDDSLSLSDSLTLFFSKDNGFIWIEGEDMTYTSDGNPLSEEQIEDLCTLGQGLSILEDDMVD